jgi:hypothetical protein
MRVTDFILFVDSDKLKKLNREYFKDRPQRNPEGIKKKLNGSSLRDSESKIDREKLSQRTSKPGMYKIVDSSFFAECLPDSAFKRHVQRPGQRAERKREEVP